MRGLAGRKAIVTGGGGEIGQAISLRLSNEGCYVGIFDIDGDAAANTARRIVAARRQSTLRWTSQIILPPLLR